MKKQLKPEAILSPVPVVMVSCGNEEKDDIVTVAWTGIINSEPPMVYISLRNSRYSYELIKETGEFVINIPNESLVKETDYCGIKSGKDVNKFEKTKLTKGKFNTINTPLIEECPVNLACKVKEIKPLGSHNMIIGEIVEVQAKDEVLNPNGTINLSKIKAIAYMGAEYYIADKKIAQRGIGM